MIQMNPFLINLSQSHLYFAAFYTAAFLVSFLILLLEGRRRKIPQLPWLIVIATGFISFVIGCRIVTYSKNDWNAILANQPVDHVTGLVMLGGLLFCVPSILLVKRLLRLEESVLDAYAFVLPVGMCLQRIGCFFNGCCFGSVTTGWGVHYGIGTSAFFDHASEGIIPVDNLHSLAVHPVQLYESLGCFAAIIVVLKVRKKFSSAGSLFYLSGLTYYVVRFFAEFFRDSNAYAVDVPVWIGLNAIQWLMLGLIIGSVIVLIVKEKQPKPTTIHGNPSISITHLVYFVLLSLIFFISSKWLRPLEIFVVHMVLFTTAGYLLWELFKTVTIPGFRLASLSLMLLSLVMMSQTFPEEAASDSTRISYNTLSVGGLIGAQNLTMTATDCDGATTSKTEYKNKYSLMGLGFSRTVQTGRMRSYTLGMSGFLGKHTEEVTGSLVSQRPDLTTYAVTPYGQLDYGKIGFGVGLHFGDMSFIETAADVTSVQRYSVYPQFYVRFGRLHRFFGELSYARNFPSAFPGTFFQANVGLPLNGKKLNSGAIRIGTSTSTGLFLAASIPAGNHFLVEPYVGFLGSPFMVVSGYEPNTGALASLSLHYKFSRHPIP